MVENTNPDRVEVLRDGSRGGPAILAATGGDQVFDSLNIPLLLDTYLGGVVIVPFDTEADLPLTITTYHILPPGERIVNIITSLCNQGKEHLYLLRPGGGRLGRRARSHPHPIR